MAASRFRSPKKWTLPERRQPRSGFGKNSPAMNALMEPERAPALRVSRTGLRNLPKKQQVSLRKERKADPNGVGVHAWRRRQW